MEEMDSLVDDMLKDMDEFHHNNRFNVLVEIEAIDNYFDKYTIAILSILVVTGLNTETDEIIQCGHPHIYDPSNISTLNKVLLSQSL